MDIPVLSNLLKLQLGKLQMCCFFSRTSIGGSLTDSVHVHSWNLGGHSVPLNQSCSSLFLVRSVHHTESILNGPRHFGHWSCKMCAPLKSQGQTPMGSWMQLGYLLCKDPDFRKHFGKEYQWLCDCGGWDVTLCHSSSVSIYPGFDSCLSEQFHFCRKTCVDMSSVMSPQKISILLRLLKYYHLPIEFVDNFCSHGDF